MRGCQNRENLLIYCKAAHEFVNHSEYHLAPSKFSAHLQCQGYENYCCQEFSKIINSKSSYNDYLRLYAAFYSFLKKNSFHQMNEIRNLYIQQKLLLRVFLQIVSLLKYFGSKIHCPCLHQSLSCQTSFVDKRRNHQDFLIQEAQWQSRVLIACLVKIIQDVNSF